MNLDTTYKVNVSKNNQNDFLNANSANKPSESRPSTTTAPRLIPFHGLTSYQATFFN